MKQMSQKKNHVSGFTLVELLVVISIMALLSAVSLPNFRQKQKSRSVALGAEFVMSTIKNVQNYALTEKTINGPACSKGSSPKYYIAMFTQDRQIKTYAVDKCNVSTLLETVKLTPSVEIKSSGYKIDGVSADALQLVFESPFAALSASSATVVNTQVPVKFTTSTITLNYMGDANVFQDITVNGISGRIGN
jgi:prepilin-type N-terminal cleavage/methylation domain-containing protein